MEFGLYIIFIYILYKSNDHDRDRTTTTRQEAAFREFHGTLNQKKLESFQRIVVCLTRLIVCFLFKSVQIMSVHTIGAAQAFYVHEVAD